MFLLTVSSPLIRTRGRLRLGRTPFRKAIDLKILDTMLHHDDHYTACEGFALQHFAPSVSTYAPDS
jgi:hypothetical protein